METSNMLLFLSVAFILLISPGPNTIYVVTKGVTEGRSAAFKAVLGASAGDMTQVLAVSLGLAVLLQASALTFFIIKMLGAGYLLYIGVRCFLNKQQMFSKASAGKTNSKDLFFTGFLTSALNPKTTLFFLSFLPQFVDTTSVYAQQQMVLFGSLFVVMGFLVMCVYAALAAELRFWIVKHEKIQVYFNWLTGAVFIGFGLRVAFSEQR